MSLKSPVVRRLMAALLAGYLVVLGASIAAQDPTEVSAPTLTAEAEAGAQAAEPLAVEAAPAEAAADDGAADDTEPTEAAVDEAAAEDAPPAAAPNAEEPVEDPRTGVERSIDATFAVVVGYMAKVLFAEIPFIKAADGSGFPFVVAWLFIGAVIFTFWMRFVNFRAFRHAIDVVRGHYDDPNDAGEVSHFQALSSALSATVGLGNIAGVAIAVSAGGPGAVFWMMVAAFFGMTAKFVECTLGQKYRAIDDEGRVLGGPMRYLEVGLAERGLGGLGQILAVLFAVFCIGGSFGGGNMFQANQAYQAFESVTSFHVPGWLFGIVLMVLVGIVILGGIRRIASTAEKIVPLMCGMYVIAALFIVAVNVAELPDALNAIFSDAFTGRAMGGGFIGVLVMGIKRAAFSNEAGIGSAAIAHSAAKTEEPVREGVVALLGPFIDTIIVCLSTGIVIVISGVLDDPASADAEGVVLTTMAFRTVIEWFPLLLTLAIILFAYSTMISWSYYGERCWTKLFGPGSSLAYRVVFLICIFIGCVSNLGSVLDFSDLMILSMAFPNILGLYLLAGVVRKDMDTYMGKLQRGEFKRFD